MDKKEKSDKKNVIGSVIDLSNGRYKDAEIDTLYDIATNRDKYDGRTETYRHSETGWYSGGKYIRNEETTYTFRSDERGVPVEEHHEEHDDDGEHWEYDRDYTTGREILGVIGKVFRS